MISSRRNNRGNSAGKRVDRTTNRTRDIRQRPPTMLEVIVSFERDSQTS